MIRLRLDGSTVQTPFRSLSSYILQHREKHPEVARAHTLTEARIICFGMKPGQKRRAPSQGTR